jgi:hydroxymethylpyrimidine pyrophosphatase-like HAD family hydrolase
VCLQDGALVIDGKRLYEVTQLHANFLVDGKAADLRDTCALAFGDEVQCIMPGVLGVDFISVRAGKPVGIRRLLELRGLQAEIVLTVGDGENDIAMLTAPDFCGYAMQSAMPVVLEQVSRTTESVAALIERYLA